MFKAAKTVDFLILTYYTDDSKQRKRLSSLIRLYSPMYLSRRSVSFSALRTERPINFLCRRRAAEWMIVMEKFDSLIIGEVAQDTNVDFDGTVVQAVGGAVYYSGCAAANMGHKIAVLPKADLSQLDVTAAFHEKAPSISVFPLNSPHSFVTKNVYHTADRERRTSTVDSLIAPYTTDEVPVDQIDAAIWHLAGLAGGDITQGLPRVEELFEARKPKKMATIAEIGGKVRFEEATKGSLLNIIITADDGDTRTYAVPHTGLLVQDGEVIEKGRQLQDGALNPHDVLRIRGASAVHNYLIQEVLKVYRQQGVDINDKHIEVIVRQMMRKVRVEDANDAEGLLSGAMADVMEVEDANAAVRARIAAGEKREDGEELQEATYTQLLMGITKASLATDSFLSAASFQETTKVLTEAAIKGKVDHLVGLKENVIIGKLIPAGAGLTAYRQLAEEMVPETEAEKKDEAEAMHTEVPTPVEAPADMDKAELPESDGPETDTGDAL